MDAFKQFCGYGKQICKQAVSSVKCRQQIYKHCRRKNILCMDQADYTYMERYFEYVYMDSEDKKIRAFDVNGKNTKVDMDEAYVLVRLSKLEKNCEDRIRKALKDGEVLGDAYSAVVPYNSAVFGKIEDEIKEIVWKDEQTLFVKMENSQYKKYTFVINEYIVEAKYTEEGYQLVLPAELVDKESNIDCVLVDYANLVKSNTLAIDNN